MAETSEARAAIDPTVYRLRANAFVRPRIYRLTGDALTWEEEGEALDGVFYDDIAEIRLAFAPTRFATNRYRAQVVFRQGGMAEFFNTDYRGIADFPENNEAYVAFLSELHRRLAEKGKETLFRTGNSPVGYALNLLVTVFIFAMIGLAFFMLTAFGLVWIAVIKLAIVLYFIPTLVRYIRRAKPATYDPLNLPDAALPAL